MCVSVCLHVPACVCVWRMSLERESMAMEVVKSKKVERSDVKNHREGADGVGDLSGENARVMAKGIMK